MSTAPVPINQLAVRGKSCPYPLLAARAFLNERPQGTLLELIATDPLAALDVAAWCARTGHRLREEWQVAGHVHLLIEKR